MNVHRIGDIENGNFYTIFSSENVEYVNPVEYFGTVFKRQSIELDRDSLMNNALRPLLESLSALLAERDWRRLHDEIIATPFPEQLITLLESPSKKEQVQLLKDASIKPEELMAFVFKAWTDFGFSFSRYRAEHIPRGVDKNDMPKVIEVKIDGVDKIGETALSDGKLKQVIEHRHVVVATFLDRKETWHCFFLTYKSLRGKENWKDGQPHYHYISDKFSIPREKILSELMSRDYSLGSLPHVNIIAY